MPLDGINQNVNLFSGRDFLMDDDEFFSMQTIVSAGMNRSFDSDRFIPDRDSDPLRQFLEVVQSRLVVHGLTAVLPTEDSTILEKEVQGQEQNKV
jgi:hypothetical protein